MYRFFSNSVTKLKNVNLQNLLTETNYKNEFNFCDVRKLSHSHLTNANTKGIQVEIATNNIVAVISFFLFRKLRQ